MNVVQSLFPFDNTKFPLSKEVFLDLTKMRCKQFCNLLLERSDISSTAIETWRRKNRYVADNWENSLQTFYKTTCDNKLRQFSFKLLHRILVTKKELKYFKITNDEKCVMCSNQDSIDHTFFECQATLQFYDHTWFNAQHKSNVKLSNLQFFLNLYQPPAHISPQQNKKLALLLICAKQYVYACKSMQKSPNFDEFSSKIKLQWKVEKCT